MKKVMLIIMVLIIAVAVVGCEQPVSRNEVATEELNLKDINFAVIVDDAKQECFIVVVLDVITTEDNYLIITLDNDILISKEEVIFCKTYTQAQTIIQLVVLLN